jgi:hypothetical protein
LEELWIGKNKITKLEVRSSFIIIQMFDPKTLESWNVKTIEDLVFTVQPDNEAGRP